MNMKYDKSESEMEIYHLAVEASEMGVFDWNLVENKIYFSSQWKKMLGFDNYEIDDNVSEWLNRIHPKDYEEFCFELNKYFNQKNEYYKSEHRILCKDGNYKWILCSGKILSWSIIGEPQRMVGTFVDITSQMGMGKNGNVAFRKAFEFCPSPMIITTFKKGICVEVNNAFLKTTGFSKEETIGRTLRELNIYKEDDYREKILNKLEREGSLKEVEVKLSTKSEEMLTVLFSVEYLNILEKNFLITVLFDITERKKFEEELKIAKSEAEQANYSKREFLANMSHEIRTPMNGVFGFLACLSKTVLSDKQQDLIDEAQKASAVMLNVINEILDFSKIESGKLRFEAINFNLRKAVTDVVSLTRPAAISKDIEILVIMDKMLPEWVIGDPYRLKQILNNILNNAIKFTNHGKINIQVNIKKEVNESIEIEFIVRDSGIGISESYLGKLFEPFTQMDESITRLYGGSGLGLTICNELVKMMNGKIYVESTQGEGSCFSFFIPFIKTQKNHVAQEASVDQISSISESRGEDIQELNILIVEDTEMNQKVVLKMLENSHVICDIACNGLEALKACDKKNYDIVFMDCQMPIMNGFAATEAIRAKENESRHTYIVAMTADAQKEQLEKCLLVGMDGYLSKPFSLNDIHQIVKNYRNGINKNSNVKKESINLEKQGNICEINIWVNRLVQEIGFNSEEARQTIFEYLNKTDKLLKTLEPLIQENLYEQVREVIHKIKGTSGNLRMIELYTMASDFEILVQNEEKNNCIKHLQEFQKYLKKILENCQK